MGDPLKRVQEGDPVSAAAFNALLDGVRASNERLAELAARFGQNPLFWQRTIVQVKNGSPDDRMRFEVLGLDSPLYAPPGDTFKEFPRLVGTTPAKASHEARFCVLQECISHLAIARAVVAGVTVVQVDMKEAWHEWADVADGTCEHLESRPSPAGAQILTVEAGTGVRWAIVRIGPPQGSPTSVYEITNDDYDTIYWDATIGAHYVFGRPMDEAAKPIVINGSADEERLYITAFFRDQFDRNEGLGSFAKGRRVYTAYRNGRREIVAPIFQDPRWMAAVTADSTVPPGGVSGVASSLDRNGRDELQTYQDDDDPNYPNYYVGNRYHVIADGNGQDDGSTYLKLARAAERPIWAAIEDGADEFTRGQPYGPIPDSWLLYPGLPGYTYVGRHQLDSDGVHRALVIRDLVSTSWLAQAKEDWTCNNSGPNDDWVLAYPVERNEGSGVYDGSESYLPTVILRIVLPRNGSSEDPCVHEGDFLYYGFRSVGGSITPWNHARTPLIAHGTYLDGKIGEVRMHGITFSNPGWVVADGTANSVGNGGTGRNMIDTFPQLKAAAGGSGGAATHAHTVSSGANVLASGADLKIDVANHLPPWSGVVPYERIH